MLWARLQFRESELMAALGTLAGLGVPALPRHDALRVPASKAGMAISVLMECFYSSGCGSPCIRVK